MSILFLLLLSDMVSMETCSVSQGESAGPVEAVIDFLSLLHAVAHGTASPEDSERASCLVELRDFNRNADRAANRDSDELRRSFTSVTGVYIFDHPMMITILRDVYEIHDQTARRTGAIPGLSGFFLPPSLCFLAECATRTAHVCAVLCVACVCHSLPLSVRARTNVHGPVHCSTAGRGCWVLGQGVCGGPDLWL